jgi:hypothetical protein
MGVHGLTTYLREHQRTLSKTLTFPHPSEKPVVIVVDGWSLVTFFVTDVLRFILVLNSFIYQLDRNSNLPWVYGGEYDQFSRLVFVVVQAWIELGFKIHFVFDGPWGESSV